LVLTDLLGVLVFSILVQVSLSQTGSSGPGLGVLLPVAWEFVQAVAIGVAVFAALRLFVYSEAGGFRHSSTYLGSRWFALRRALAARPSPSVELLLITIAVVSAGTGLAYYLHLPFLMTAIVAGFLVANYHTFAIFHSLKIGNVAALFNLAFFALVGATMSLSVKGHTLGLAAVYIVMRTVGKFGGAWLACRLCGEDVKITAALPSQLLPQTGVAAVEAVFLASILNRPDLEGIILPAIVFFGVAGVVQVEWTLRRYQKRKIAEGLSGPRKPESGLALSARHFLGHLSPDSIVPDLKGASKMDVITELVDRAMECSQQYIDREQTLQVLAERESLVATGVGHGVAIPHCRLIGLDESVVVLGRHSAPPVFGGVDNEPSDLIVLVLSSVRGSAEHLQLMAAVTHLFGKEEGRRAIRQAEGVYDVLAAIIKIAEPRNAPTPQTA